MEYFDAGFGPRVFSPAFSPSSSSNPIGRSPSKFASAKFLQPLPARVSGRRRAAFRHRRRACATEAQEFGFSTILQFFERFIDAPLAEKERMARSRDVYGFWQGLLRVVGSFGDCPRCLAVCPVGNDYHAHLADAQKAIPEKTPEKVALGKSYREKSHAGRRDRRPQRLEQALGRAPRIQRHGGAAVAGI